MTGQAPRSRLGFIFTLPVVKAPVAGRFPTGYTGPSSPLPISMTFA